MYLGNSPQETTVLRLEARKSFALSVWVRDASGRPLDLDGTSLRFVMMKKLPRGTDPGDITNLAANVTAEIVDALEGMARLSLQAADLNLAPAEYPFAIVMDTNGYSTVAAKGIVDLQQNTEFASINSTYMPSNPPASVTLSIDSRSQVTLQTGPTLAPGTTSFTDGDKEKLDSIEHGAQVNVGADWLAEEGQPGYIRYRPRFGTAAFHDLEDLLALPKGGAPGEVLVKLTGDDYLVGWQQPSSAGGGGSLPAAGVTAGYVPTATGAGGWGWAKIVSGVEVVNGKQGNVTLTLDDLNDTATRMAMTAAERAKLAGLDTSISYNNLQDKPALGTASALNTNQVLQPGGVSGADITTGTIPAARIPSVSTLPGFRSGTATPSGGFDGELYFQYT